jgi:hypothetical protein
MTALDVKDFEAVSSKPKIDKNALALKAINDNWKGNGVGAATAAALDIGMLVAGCMLAYDKGKDNVLRGFEVRKVDEKWWSKRVLTVVKANHGRVGEKIEMRWNDGVYVLDTGPDPVADKMLKKTADEVFMAVFSKLTGQGQALGPNVGPSYAPKKISGHPDAKGYTKADLAAAMQRLLDAGRLRIEVTGPPSRRYTELVAALN